MSAAVAALPTTLRATSGSDAPFLPNPPQQPIGNGTAYRLDQTPASSIESDSLLRLTPDQVEIQARLGSGAFSSVFAVELRGVPTNRINSHNNNHNSQKSSSKQQKHQQSNAFAIKRLRADVLMDSSKQVAMTDFCSEMKILITLPRHPNIVSLHAVSQDFEASPDRGFLILEKLQETLQARVARWEMRARYLFKFNKISLWNVKARKALEAEEQTFRIKVAAVGVAKAMEHLHHHGILYRDIKPSNIGFAVDGTVKVFDFGMARKCNGNNQDTAASSVPSRDIKSMSKDQNHLYVGTAGTARYMAPEVAMNQPYGLPADVHSFGILLWQICSLQTPYKQMTSLDAWFKTAVLLKRRPNLRQIASPRIQTLTQACWDPNPDARPGFSAVAKELEQEVSKPASSYK
mmetsp:Transcript_7837/g.16319  ORF Transcript_7837/g.16319 Transcript_7837/m.16319 type:complete len:405 (+) Transcript_7837:151-1365(+)|eukprot:CAMPEP_0168738290 /NCGR_PEP_ID=MMETSP0724-20121128/10852_1 /TAXON_ID=265536 /ORGANISM="Amphiprora sp., Strain CCMP467" /LENGTH=404 /DNA_ID=CAMNT_0008785619 /DNA_START=127 /DNA_END=1341 /DNA_ORIENTATION=-